MYNIRDSHGSFHLVQFKICDVKNASKSYLQIPIFSNQDTFKKSIRRWTI